VRRCSARRGIDALTIADDGHGDDDDGIVTTDFAEHRRTLYVRKDVLTVLKSIRWAKAQDSRPHCQRQTCTSPSLLASADIDGWRLGKTLGSRSRGCTPAAQRIMSSFGKARVVFAGQQWTNLSGVTSGIKEAGASWGTILESISPTSRSARPRGSRHFGHRAIYQRADHFSALRYSKESKEDWADNSQGNRMTEIRFHGIAVEIGKRAKPVMDT